MWLVQAAQLRSGLSTSLPAAGDDLTSFFGTSAQLWATGLIFIRLAGMIMLIPGLGDASVPPRLRLSFCLLLAMMITPIVGPVLPPMPDKLGPLTGIILHETIIGLMIGTLMRVLIFTLQTAGEIMSIQTSLSYAQTANPTEAQSSTSIASFLSVLGMVMIWVTNTHHLFIRAMIDSYQIFSPVRTVMIGDALTLMVRTVSESLVLALQLSAPIIVFALVLNIATGFVGRMMPNFQVYFAVAPLSVLIGLSLLALSLGTLGMVFIDHYQELLAVFIARPR
ncbi:MAG: flagellar biosynthetic protein FliR [Asticcacaulis sp.]|uniref:flagellar biosynthetic protein FliR n=1 Tax=Asticcacaulis sp. TaxID=1872648 RepID=UPI0039E58A74